MPEITTRLATPEDAAAMCCLLNTIIAKGGSTAYTTPFDVDRMTSNNINHPRGISCIVALDGALIVGFQWLKRGDPNQEGDGKLPDDWASIASFVADGQQGKGIGGRLFAATLVAAQDANISNIDATIRTYNTSGLAYYSRLGFVDYRETDTAISKKYAV